MPGPPRSGRAAARPPYSASLLQAAAALYGIDAVENGPSRPAQINKSLKSNKKFREL